MNIYGNNLLCGWENIEKENQCFEEERVLFEGGTKRFFIVFGRRIHGVWAGVLQELERREP